MKVSATLLALGASTAYAMPNLVARADTKDPCGFKYTIHKFPPEIKNVQSNEPGQKYFANIAPVIAKFSEGCLISKKPWDKTNQPRCGVCHQPRYKWHDTNPKNPVTVHGKRLNDGNENVLFNHQFFLKVPESGDYTFSFRGPQDDISLMYIGEKALQGFTYENADLKSELYSKDENKSKDGKRYDVSVTRTYEKDKVVPIRILTAQSTGPDAHFCFHILDPKGNCILGPKTRKGTTKGIFQSVGDKKFPEFPFTIQPVPGIRYTIHKFTSAQTNDPKDKYFTIIKPVIDKISQDPNPPTGDTYRLGYNYNLPDPMAPVQIYQTKVTDGNNWLITSHKFFLKVPATGEYVFTAVGVQDDLTLLWLGDKALAGYNYDNNNLFSEYFTKDENTDEGNSKSTRKTYNKDDVVPIRILAINAQGECKFNFKITGPEGVGTVVGPDTKKPDCKHIFQTDPGRPGQPSGGVTTPTGGAGGGGGGGGGGGTTPLPPNPVGPTGIKIFPANPYKVTPHPPDEEAGGY